MDTWSSIDRHAFWYKETCLCEFSWNTCVKNTLSKCAVYMYHVTVCKFALLLIKDCSLGGDRLLTWRIPGYVSCLIKPSNALNVVQRKRPVGRHWIDHLHCRSQGATDLCSVSAV